MIARVAAFLFWAGTAFAAGDAVRGKELFRSCQSCHSTASPDGQASNQRMQGPSLQTLFGKVTLRNGKHVDDENVRELVEEGFNGMPAFGYSFRAAEIDDLMAYLHTLTGKPSVIADAPGAAYFKSYCLRCHNPDSQSAAGPDLRGQFKPESVPLIEEGHAGSPVLKEWLGEKERGLLFAYLKSY